ncbi:hypothetical protein RFI_11544 [Reticulomyxa filosa]|uniref:Uncharacterized protein n=1 Tax=Reticulomyxa filosa TaxID=46433 RepID=X6NJQ7_RETFI|nr:hypothetical protein RFI_11544 [Reticulomyxa filosa]|eukprot:ETO25592.1 hypothetical protein RFI_11544 [Reticulomyxa filosa]
MTIKMIECMEKIVEMVTQGLEHWQIGHRMYALSALQGLVPKSTSHLQLHLHKILCHLLSCVDPSRKGNNKEITKQSTLVLQALGRVMPLECCLEWCDKQFASQISSLSISSINEHLLVLNCFMQGFSVRKLFFFLCNKSPFFSSFVGVVETLSCATKRTRNAILHKCNICCPFCKIQNCVATFSVRTNTLEILLSLLEKSQSFSYCQNEEIQTEMLWIILQLHARQLSIKKPLLDTLDHEDAKVYIFFTFLFFLILILQQLILLHFIAFLFVQLAKTAKNGCTKDLWQCSFNKLFDWITSLSVKKENTNCKQAKNLNWEEMSELHYLFASLLYHSQSFIADVISKIFPIIMEFTNTSKQPEVKLG